MNLKLDFLNLAGFDEKGLRRLDQWSRQLIQTLTATTREIKTVELNPTTQLPFSFITGLTNPQAVNIVRCHNLDNVLVRYQSNEPCTWYAVGNKVTIESISGLPNNVFRIILEIRSEL